MIGAGLFHCFRLGALGEGWVAEPRGEAVALLFGGGESLRQARLFDVEINNVGDRDDVGAISNHDLWANMALSVLMRFSGAIEHFAIFVDTSSRVREPNAIDPSKTPKLRACACNAL